jgi:hypoxanthine phosphoribosyltransferase
MNHRILIEKEQLSKKVEELGAKISRNFEGMNPLLVGILKGAYIFMADLSRAIAIPHTVDFMSVSSYGSSTSTSGVVRILKDLDVPLFHRHVIIVEDIVDSGLTLKYIKRLLQARSPSSLSVCALLDKRENHAPEDIIDYTGFVIPNHFVIGYGLDFDQHYRNLPYIAYFENPEGNLCSQE